tara:strand:+ start:104 stop:334 length:231 start_codon:yes stop_codon:yes gene_type:complete
MDLYWCKWYGYDEEYPDEPNYLAISAILFNRDFHLMIIPSYFAFIINVTENLQTQWDELNGPPRIPYHYTFNPLGK